MKATSHESRLHVVSPPPRLEIAIGDSGPSMLAFNSTPHDPRPYAHPLRPRDGIGVLTQDRPDHHPWQHGLYTGLHAVGDSDFWFDHGQRPTAGRIDITDCSLDPHEQSDLVAWQVRCLWRSHVDNRPLLEERQGWRLRLTADSWRLELDWSLQAREALTIEADIYGGPFLRMPYTDPAGCRVLNAQRQVDDACEQARAAWLCLTMPIAERTDAAGFIFSAHPHDADPTPAWRVDRRRGVGPIVVREPLQLASDDSHHWRYGLTCVVGEPSAEACEELHRHYTEGVQP